MALLTILLAGLLSACGLSSERERSVARANEAIEDVDRAGQRIAEAIATLSKTSAGSRDLSGVRDSAEAYLREVERLNGALRGLGETSPKLQAYMQDAFRPAAENAAADCQRAIDTLRADADDDESIRAAITLIGRCIDSYASAVSGVSAQYSALSE